MREGPSLHQEPTAPSDTTGYRYWASSLVIRGAEVLECERRPGRAGLTRGFRVAAMDLITLPSANFLGTVVTRGSRCVALGAYGPSLGDDREPIGSLLHAQSAHILAAMNTLKLRASMLAAAALIAVAGAAGCTTTKPAAASSVLASPSASSISSSPAASPTVAPTPTPKATPTPSPKPRDHDLSDNDPTTKKQRRHLRADARWRGRTTMETTLRARTTDRKLRLPRCLVLDCIPRV